MANFKFVLCNHCQAEILLAGKKHIPLNKNIGEADSVTRCTNCQCEVLYNSKTLKVVDFSKVEQERLVLRAMQAVGR